MKYQQKQLANLYYATINNAKTASIKLHDLVFIEESNTIYIAKSTTDLESLPTIIVINNGLRLFAINSTYMGLPQLDLYTVGNSTSQTNFNGAIRNFVFNTNINTNPNFSLNTTTGAVTVLSNYTKLEITYKLLFQKTTGSTLEQLVAQIFKNDVLLDYTTTVVFQYGTSQPYTSLFNTTIVNNVLTNDVFELKVFMISNSGQTVSIVGDCFFEFKETLF